MGWILIQNYLLYCLNSSDKKKTSLHIIYRGMAFNSVEDHKNWTLDFMAFITILDDSFIPLRGKCIDKSVYSKNRCFRMIGCSKLGSSNYLTPFGGIAHPEKYSITVFDKNMPLTTYYQKIPKIKESE